MNETKWQELKDAAAHSKHNGGRVSVECGDLEELLTTWERSNVKTHSCDGKPATRAEFDAFLAEGYPRPVVSNEPTPSIEVAAEAVPDDATPDAPEPTIQ